MPKVNVQLIATNMLTNCEHQEFVSIMGC
uniref:Uncharacterized protein n=1 Tax=Arundo donax TaxID=35708 RepID=A0A0A9CIC4_ARUDO